MPSMPVSAAIPTIDGVFNLRELGGLTTRDGRHTRRHLVFRADGLHRASTIGRRQIIDLGVRDVVDLRTIGEVDREGRFDHPDARFEQVPVVEHLDELMSTFDPAVDDLLGHHYLHMAEHNGQAFATALELIARSIHDGRSVVYHCTAGKDRTGVLTALLLAALGVDDDTIADDYARSAPAMTRMVEWYRSTTTRTPQERMAEMGMDPSLATVMLRADRSTMLEFLAELRRRHDTIDAYLDGVGATDAVATIADHLLMPAGAEVHPTAR